MPHEHEESALSLRNCVELSFRQSDVVHPNRHATPNYKLPAEVPDDIVRAANLPDIMA